MTKTMRAMQIEIYGHTELKLKQVPMPTIAPDEVLVAIKAASVNPIDSKTRGGDVKLLVKHEMPMTLGQDFAGIVTQIGSRVTKFQIGDEVYGRPRDSQMGTFADYLAVNEADVAIKPRNLSFDEAAAVPLVSLTSYQALVDLAKIKPGQKVFIQAGAGGVGSIAIQMAKHLGAYVATTASSKNAATVQALGADQVVDYHTDHFDEVLHDYDMVFDTLGGTYLTKSFKILKPGGMIVSISGLPDAKFARARKLGWFKALLFGLVTSNLTRLEKRFQVSYQFWFMKASGTELAEITRLIDQDKLKPIIDRSFALEDAQQALAYSEAGHAHGKIVIKVSD